MNESRENRELDAMQIIGMILKSWWIIVLAIVLCVGVAIGYTELCTTQTYQSTSTLLLNGGGEANSVSSMAQQILAGQYQSKDYPYILNARDTMNEVAERLNEIKGEKIYSAGSVSAMVKSESVTDSRIFRIAVTTTDPEEARLVAEQVTIVFMERVESLTKVEVSVVDNPAKGSAGSNGWTRNTLLGLAIGLVLGVVAAIIIGLANDTLENESWLIEKYQDKIPLLSSIPDANSGKHGAYYKSKYKYRRGYGYYRVDGRGK